MKTVIKNLFGLASLALIMSACGSNNSGVTTNAQGQTCVNGVCTGGTNLTGSNLISSGLISFTGTAQTVNSATVYAQQLQVGSGAVGGSSQISPKVSQYNGTFTIYESVGTSNVVSGTIQLSPSVIQTLVNNFGPSAIVTSVSLSVAQNLSMYNYGTYSGSLNSVLVYLYINGQPIQIVF